MVVATDSDAFFCEPRTNADAHSVWTGYSLLEQSRTGGHNTVTPTGLSNSTGAAAPLRAPQLLTTTLLWHPSTNLTSQIRRVPFLFVGRHAFRTLQSQTSSQPFRPRPTRYVPARAHSNGPNTSCTRLFTNTGEYLRLYLTRRRQVR